MEPYNKSEYPYIDMKRNIVGNEPNPWFSVYDVSTAKPVSGSANVPQSVETPTVYKQEQVLDSKTEDLTKSARKLMSERDLQIFDSLVEQNPDKDPAEILLFLQERKENKWLDITAPQRSENE